MRTFLINLLLFCTVIVSCDVYPQDDYEELYVVESYLIEGRELPGINISTTAPANAFYTFEDVAVEDAVVEIRLMSDENPNEVEQVFPYTITNPGRYSSTISHFVQPLRTYELYITFPNSDEEISAQTIVPETFQIMEGVQDSVVYQGSVQLEITVSESFYPGRQNIFIFNSISLSPTIENLTPFYYGFFEDSDGTPDDLILLANNNSGIINEGNFEINPDGSFTIKYPWIGFSFFGDNLLVANTIDDNVYDYVRSQSVQLGGSSLSPGEIQNVIHNIRGAVGVFGAIASDTVTTYVKRPINP
ncbi:MAG: DUF4249 family protein [Balneolaceae bacterium]